MSEFNWTPDEIAEIVNENRLVLFMKGTPEMPQCGFSNRAAQVLKALNEPFVSINVLSDPRASQMCAIGLISRPCLKSTFMVNSSEAPILPWRCINPVISSGFFRKIVASEGS